MVCVSKTKTAIALALHILALVSAADGFVMADLDWTLSSLVAPPRHPAAVASVGRRRTAAARRVSSAGTEAAPNSEVEDATTAVSAAETPPSSSSSRASPARFAPAQHALRAAPLVIAAAYLRDPRPLDDLVDGLWSILYGWDWARAPLFEAEVAVAGFYTWIVLFSSLHLFLGEERTKRARFDGDLPHGPFEWLAPDNYHLWFNPTAAYLGSIWLYLQVHVKPPLPEAAPTFGVLALETLFGLWLYDLCFMPIHYLLHHAEVRGLRKVHRYHHRKASTLNALEVVQHSYLDGFLQVAVNILVQQISPFGGAKHVLSRLLHNLTVTYLLTEAHSGYRDLPFMSHNLFPELLGGAPRHEAHHHNGRVYYQQYFKYLDDFFGFTEEQQRTTLQPPRLATTARAPLANATTLIPMANTTFVDGGEAFI